MTPYSNSRIVRRCGQLGIPYFEAIASPFFARQGMVAPELFVQYTEGVNGYTGSPERRRPLDSLKTLPHDLHALRALLFCGPAEPLARGGGQQGPKCDHVGVVIERSSCSSSESSAISGVSPFMTESGESSPFGDLELDLSDIVGDEGDALAFVADEQPRARAENSYIPPALPRERWKVAADAGYDYTIDWLVEGADVVIDGEGWLPARRGKHQRRNNDFRKRGKNGRKSKKRPRSIRGSWVSLAPAACRVWCDAVVEKGFCVERDIDELIAECDGDTSAEDLRIQIKRALEGFGLEARNESDVAATLWDHPTDVDPDDLYTAVDAALNRSIMLPGTERLTMVMASDEAELQALLAARQELVHEILSSNAALQTTIRLKSSGDSDFSSELQVLNAWIDSGRPTHGKAWRAAVGAVQMFGLSASEYHRVLNESVLEVKGEADTRPLVRSFEQYTLLLTKTQTRYLPYVRRMVSRSLASNEDMEDAFQSGVFGLLRALDKLKGKSAVAFRNYVSRWIDTMFFNWRADHARLIRIPRNRFKDLQAFGRALSKIRTVSNRVFDRQLLADQLGWNLETVVEFELFLRTSVPLPDILDRGAWGANPVADYLVKELRDVIKASIEKYEERDAMVMRLYYGLDHSDEYTLEAIGTMCGVTRERIRQLRERTVKRLRHGPEGKVLSAFAIDEDEL